MEGRQRSDIHSGARGKIVRKADQRTGKLTEGTIQDIPTKSAPPHGIKVRLMGGLLEIIP